MEKKYNQIDLIKHIASIVPDTIERTTYKVNTFFDLLKHELFRGNRIEFRGLGAFFLKKMPGYLGRNPKTGESIDVPKKTKISFRMSTNIKRKGIKCRQQA